MSSRLTPSRRVGLLLAAAIAVLATLIPAQAANAVPKKFWGVHAFERPLPADYKLMRKAGIGIVRMQIFWGIVEETAPNPDGSHNYNWAGPDAWMKEAAAAKVAVQGALYGSPAWLTSDPAVAPIYSGKGRSAWRAFTRAVVSRYGRDGNFWEENPNLPVRPIKTYQIWNEQNSGARYKPAPDPEGYAELVEIASIQIRDVDKGAEVMLGGMFGTPGVSGSIYAWDFLDELYDIKGFKKSFDSVAAHPYAEKLRDVEYQMNKFHNALVRNNARNTPLAVTEIGWSSGKPREGNFFYQGSGGQAKLLGESFKLFIKNQEKWNVSRVLWHVWRDPSKPIFRCGSCDKMGLVDKDLNRKPSYETFKKYATR